MAKAMSRCVVVADDDPMVISVLKLRLNMAKFDVISTGDALSVIALVKANVTVAVILDVQMPGGGGLAALSRIKSDPQLSKLPVMMLTGERNAETVLNAMGNGADDYMVKPFNPDALAERLSRLIDRGGRAPLTPWQV